MTPRYSRRLPWSISPNALSAAVAEIRRSGGFLFDLTNANPTTAGLDYPHRDIAAAFGVIGQFRYEPDPAGSLAAREAICGYYAAANILVTPQRLFLTSSTSEAYSHLFKLLCDPGDEVLIPLPSYPLFEYLARLESVDTAPYWLRYDGSWHIDFSSIAKAMNDRTRAIVLVSPNNPTGSVLSDVEVKKLFELASRRNVALIADEVFSDYFFNPAARVATPLLHSSDALVFSLNGLSKLAGMPQMKLGWIAMSGPEAALKECGSNLETILDTYLSPGTPVQSALPHLLDIGHGIRAQIQTRVRQNLRTLQQFMTDSAATVLQADAGWTAIIQLPRTLTEDQWVMKLLKEARVLVQPGYFYDMPSEAFLVVSLLTAPETLEEGAGRLREMTDQMA